ncbi:MAG: LPS assembly lipoprotein LptE [Syntrophales bacterium]|nr:LPS assembly lipoprotein LptE [Syntrophales bacterium]
MIKKLFILVLCLLMPASCGYHFAGSGDNIDPSVREVYVAPFNNSTSEALIENYVRNDFIDQFRRSGRFAIAGSAETCDALVSGTVIDIRSSRATYTVADSAIEDRIYMRMDVIFKERGGGILWSQSNFSGYETYLVSDDPGITERNRTAALRKLSNDLAERAYRSMMSGF